MVPNRAKHHIYCSVKFKDYPLGNLSYHLQKFFLIVLTVIIVFSLSKIIYVIYESDLQWENTENPCPVIFYAVIEEVLIFFTVEVLKRVSLKFYLT